MVRKAVGAFFVVIGCGSFGFLKASNARKAVKELTVFLNGIVRIKLEMQYQLQPLPCIFRTAAGYLDGLIGQVFLRFADEMESQCHPDLYSCMMGAVAGHSKISQETKDFLLLLAKNLGNLDLDNQLVALEHVEKLCGKERSKLEEEISKQKRYYETLGLCAGATLAIILV